MHPARNRLLGRLKSSQGAGRENPPRLVVQTDLLTATILNLGVSPDNE